MLCVPILFEQQALAFDSCEGPFEIVFLLDSSADAVDVGGLFLAQKQLIKDALCETGAFVPADGSVAVAVVPFGSFAFAEIELTTIRTPADADAICAAIDDIDPFRGDPDLWGALNEATLVFDAAEAASTVSASGRLVVVLSQKFDFSVMSKAEQLRTRDDVPARICATDIHDCTASTDDGFEEMVNATGSMLFDPAQVEGEFSCLDMTVMSGGCLCPLVNRHRPDCDGNGIPDVCEAAFPTGACCGPGAEECSIKTECDCVEAGGNYRGDSSDCGVGFCANSTVPCADDSDCGFCVGGFDDGLPCQSYLDCEEGLWPCLIRTCNPPSSGPCDSSACCDTSDGTCTDETAIDCEGVFDVSYPGASCLLPSMNCCLQPGPPSGKDECTDADATRHDITVPARDAQPLELTITISGDNSDATTDTAFPYPAFDPTGTVRDAGWWEAFHIDACAYVTIDFCCTDPVFDPAWAVLFESCPAVAPVHAIEPIDPRFDRIDPAQGRGAPFCTDDNRWINFGPLQPGTYYYPVHSGPSALRGPYQMHITVRPCGEAACCLSDYFCVDPDIGLLNTDGQGNPIPCDLEPCNTGDCESICALATARTCDAAGGYYLATPNLPSYRCAGGPAVNTTCDPSFNCPGGFACSAVASSVVDCGDSPSVCEMGACCDNNQCADYDINDEVRVNWNWCYNVTEGSGSFVGGAGCDYPKRPCPLDLFDTEEQCQSEAAEVSVLSQDSTGAAAADDFVAGSDNLIGFSVKGVYLPASSGGSTVCDVTDPSFVSDNFEVRVYEDSTTGVPGAEIGMRTAEVLTRFADNDEWRFQLSFGATPIGGLVPGKTYWLEVVNVPVWSPAIACVWHWSRALSGGNEYSVNTTDGVYTEEDVVSADFVYCLDGNQRGGLLKSSNESASSILLVDGVQASGGTGRTWATAVNDVQRALEIARDRRSGISQIWVAAGTHTPSSSGSRDESFDLVSGVGLYGGFEGLSFASGGETVRLQRDVAENETFLSGDLDGNDTHNGGYYGAEIAENSYHVVTDRSEGGVGTVLDGFTIERGNASEPGDDVGGGMLVDSDSPTLIRNNKFRFNFAHDGAGLHVTPTATAPTISQCEFELNIADTLGAGVWSASDVGRTAINDCLFVENAVFATTGARAGGIYASGQGVDVVNSTITRSYQGGVVNAASSTTVTNSILWGNYDGVGGPVQDSQVRSVSGSADPDVTFSVIQDAQADGEFVYPGVGNIDKDPQFIDPDGPDHVFGTLDEDLRLKSTTPCFGTGNNSAVTTSKDLAGNERIVSCTVDMGAYETQVTSISAPTVPSPSIQAGYMKNRYITVVPSNTGAMTALRVTVVASDPCPTLITACPVELEGGCDFSILNGTTMWVGSPLETSESAAYDGPHPSYATFWAAPLTCTPHYTDWGDLGLVHVYGAQVVPNSIYEFQQIHRGCDIANPLLYSAPSPEILTALYGDVVRTQSAGIPPDEDPLAPTPPDECFDIPDVLSVLDKFSNTPNAVMKTRADHAFAIMDRKIDVTDALEVLRAFQGMTYQFPPVVGCP